MHIEIDISDETDGRIGLPANESIANVIETVLKLESLTFDCEVSMVFTDNEGIRALNRDYRHKDIETDVLSFPQYERITPDTPLPPYVYLGDIVISLMKAKEQSETFDHSFEREIFYLIVHSVLHLLGYDHIDENDKKIMREREKVILKTLGIFKS